MRVKRVLRAIGVLTPLASLTVVGTAYAHHGPAAVTDPVTACGQIVTANLTLTHNVGPCVGHGLVVAASNVTINLNGFTITGDGPATEGAGDAGILLDGVSNVVVTSSATAKGTVRLFNAGVVIDGGSGNTVQNLAVVSNQALGKDGTYLTDLGEGIQVTNSDSNVIRANDIKENTGYAGITLLGDSDSNKIGNDGVAGNGNDANHVENNDEADSIFAKQTSGIRLELLSATVCPNDNVIDGNKVELNGNDGVQMFNCATGNVVINNTIEDNGRDGVHLFPGANNNHIGVTAGGVAGANTIKENGTETLGDGINVGGSNNKVKNNTVQNNEEDGISLGFCRQNLPHQPVNCFSTATGNEVQNNTVSGNGTVKLLPPTCPTGDPACNTVDGELSSQGSGIHALRNASSNTISGNTVSGSVLFDLRDDNNNCTTNTWTANTETTKNPSCLT